MIAATSTSSGGSVIALVVVLFARFALYFVPTMVVLARKKRESGPVIVVNVLLGWTFIGWVVALAMAFGDNRSVTIHNYQGTLGFQAVPPTSPPVSLQQAWFPDAADTSLLRWWDGANWTDATSPRT
jgi:hypothetical protein